MIPRGRVPFLRSPLVLAALFYGLGRSRPGPEGRRSRVAGLVIAAVWLGAVAVTGLVVVGTIVLLGLVALH
ncbi:hypothetical protein AS850_01745 [Frondihabitans sp. 762G35]|uniref:hypothetical protein n=1 Tax=Frondihabitans sp. 762G35 TaxID=1446794 RepID=UPI000D216481|nr:hypothetical protein [Frondihabitans sp. 762G35]ARC55800.1 hypothetical protein AS850_01745 [Frondihabitans sp. 762G35]